MYRALLYESVMSKHKIAIISDTHSLIRPEIRETLEGCEYILHGGDIADRNTYDEILSINPGTFVRGNADKEWAEFIPAEQEFKLWGLRFYMVHNKKHIRKDLSDVDFVIYGHSHKYEDYIDNGVHYLNPGSCGPRRFHQPVTMMVLTIDAATKDVEIQKIDCSPKLKAGESNLSHKDMDRLLAGIMKDMDANRSVEDIAKRNRVDEEFARQVLQIYTTHPGIDVDGIMNRMDILGKITNVDL